MTLKQNIVQKKAKKMPKKKKKRFPFKNIESRVVLNYYKLFLQFTFLITVKLTQIIQVNILQNDNRTNMQSMKNIGKEIESRQIWKKKKAKVSLNSGNYTA